LITEEYCLTQLISEPTHLTPTSETLIDVIFTSHSDLFTSSGTFPFSNSDHLLIYGECTFKIGVSQSCTKVFCYKNCNDETFLADLNVIPGILWTYLSLLIISLTVGIPCLLQWLRTIFPFIQFACIVILLSR